MKFPDIDRYYTGVLVPVLSLRSRMDGGVGEFADLPLLGAWCRDAGIDVIQILPVNDTGRQSSPYSALSAMALNPIYIRLDDVPEIAAEAATGPGNEISGLLAELQHSPEAEHRVSYRVVLERKLTVLRNAYARHREQIFADDALSAWIGRNAWVKPYSAFLLLKRRNNYSHWRDWGAFADPTEAAIDSLWNDSDSREEVIFHAWVQYNLENQLASASRTLESMGVYLKGDLPILMDEDSVDVWEKRRFFSLDLRAGAPPDMFSDLGQNWGFPVYDWNALAAEEYSWWKNRLRQADKFYHAYRIDHVLGFFRIWATPETNSSGIMGYFFPSAPLTEPDLRAAGFDESRVQWLAEPHLSDEVIRTAFGEAAASVIDKAFARVGHENLYLFSEMIRGEKDILHLAVEDHCRDALLSIYRDRALIRRADGEYAATWNFRSCSRYITLSDEEKARFEALVGALGARSETMWEQQGNDLLRFMNSTVPMLTCAEDLGVIPESVPRVLASLGILSLRIPRWARMWNEDGQPFIKPHEYPFLSVCAPSVHDTSTLREWWSVDGARGQFWHALELPGECPAELTAEAALSVFRKLMETGSALFITQIQDFFALEPKLRVEEPSAERVNIPGTYNDSNWSYRIGVHLEELREYESWNRTLRELTGERRARPIQL